MPRLIGTLGRVLLAALLSSVMPAASFAQSSSPAASSPVDPTGPTASPDSQVMPAGTQFDDRAPISEQAASELLSGYVEHDGVQLQLTSSARVSGYNYLSTTKARTRPSGGRKWKTSTLDDGKRWKAPRGLPSRRGAYPVGVVAGPHGFVATGNQGFWDSPNNYRFASAGSIWHSRDGRKWSRFDPRTILGQRISHVLSAPGVGPDGRYFVAASVGPQDLQGPSKIVVMSSTDGRDWSTVATIDTRWTLGAGGVTGTADGLRLYGQEYLCESDSTFHNSFAVAPRTHIWESDAAGREWRELDATAGGLLQSAEQPPAKASDCPKDLTERVARFGVAGRLFSHLPGVLLGVDEALERVSFSRDGLGWNIAELPGAASAEGGRDPRASVVTLQPDGSVVLLSLEARRIQGRPTFGQHQVLAWRTTDDGMTWNALPATRPIELTGRTQSLQPLADGSVMLMDSTIGSTETVTRRLVSTAGPLVAWGTCVPAPGADCRFTDLRDVDVHGADLTGIDLAHSTIASGDWTGAILRDARLVDTTVDTSLDRADLTNADATGARLPDLSKATLDGTTLRLVRVPLAQLEGGARMARTSGMTVEVPSQRSSDIDLTGLDLRGVSFSSYDPTLGDLRDVDFGGLRMDGASFFRVDLTGARLGKAKFDRLTFYGPDTICPDGKPAKDGVYDQTACRMKAPK